MKSLIKSFKGGKHMTFILILLSLAMITEILSILLKGGGDDDDAE